MVEKNKLESQETLGLLSNLELLLRKCNEEARLDDLILSRIVQISTQLLLNSKSQPATFIVLRTLFVKVYHNYNWVSIK